MIIDFFFQENQVMALKEKGIAAEFLSSTQTSKVREKVIVGFISTYYQVCNSLL